MGSLTRWLIVAALIAVARPAAADAPPPPGKWFGWSLRMGPRPVRDAHAFEADMGLHIGGVHAGQLRGGLEYDFLMTSESTPDSMESLGHGIGHRVTVLTELPLWNPYSSRMHMRGYLSVEAGAAFTLLHDSYTGFEAEPNAVVGVRFGYEMFADGETPSRRLADYISVRWITHGDAVGWLFGVSMEWGD